MLAFLITANLAGFFVGIYYYWDQLAASPPALWIVIMDSPLSVLLFSIMCLLFYFRKKVPEAFKFLAAAYVIKYGAWTMLTLYLYWANYAAFNDQVIGVLDFILHLGMVIEGIILIPKIRPKIADALLVLFICIANDFFDYFLGTVTKIPPTYMNFLMLESFVASVLITLSIAVYQISTGSKGKVKP